MTNLPYFVSLEEALDICRQTKLVVETEQVNLDDAHGRILAQDLASLVNDPPFDNSAMDGFAVRHEDTLSPPTDLKIIATIQAAGQEDNVLVGEGEAVRIMTGAPMPKGTDAILQVELCETDGDRVRLLKEGMKHFIRFKGENMTEGQIALNKGAHLTPSRVGLCATMGHGKVPVVKRLKVAIISTGDELIQPGEALSRGEIYESNSFGIAGLVKWLGHEPVRMHCVDDTLDALRTSLNEAANTCDLILTSGGVSMGEWDLVRKIMEEEGDLHFWRVKLRPGSPPLFGIWNDCPIFGLPGNPVSSHIVFRMLVAPWLRGVTSADGPIEARTTARLGTNVKATQDCLTMRRVSLEITSSGLVAHQRVHQGSGNLTSIAWSDGLVVLQPASTKQMGDVVDVIIL